MGLVEEIHGCKVAPGELAIFWLGQAGFLLKDHKGRTLAVDPYLTNCGERIRGFKRLSPMLISPSDFTPQYYITTHTHFDHFDYDAIPVVAQLGKTKFYGPASCIDEFQKLGLHEECTLFTKGDTIALDDSIFITAFPADHGTMAPDAIGLLLEMDGHKIYFSGDTSFHPEWCERIAAYDPEIAALSINGAFGNMNAEEGAQAAKLLRVKGAIPCHFWTFTEHGGEPQRFRELLEADGACQAICMRQGEMLLLGNKEAN